MKKVVVIGGGFAGSEVARYLEKKFDVTLIDTKEHFEFTPGVLRTIVEQEHISHIQLFHTNYLKRAKVLIGKVKEISEKFVIVGKKKIDFDYLVISSGSRYEPYFKEPNLVYNLRARNLRNCHDQLLKAKKVLIAGGGLVGVELAGEILWKYGREKEITIVHAHDKLIERNNSRAINYAEKHLLKLGVKIFYNEMVIGSKDGKFFTDKGRELDHDIAFLCTGILPNYHFMEKNFGGFLDSDRHIKVNEFLKVHGLKNIFAAGDITNTAEEKTAQNATRQGAVIAKNIRALESGKELVRYKARTGPLVISLGKYNGIFTYKNFSLGGLIPAMMKAMIEDWEMWKRRYLH